MLLADDQDAVEEFATEAAGEAFGEAITAAGFQALPEIRRLSRRTRRSTFRNAMVSAGGIQ